MRIRTGAYWTRAGFSTPPEGKATVVALRSDKAQDVKGSLGRGGQLQVN